MLGTYGKHFVHYVKSGLTILSVVSCNVLHYIVFILCLISYAMGL